MKKIAIVTVDYNGHDLTVDFLKSAEKLTFSPAQQIKFIVVDNGSDTPLHTHLPKLKLDIDTIQMGGNLGFTGGYNRGMAYALAWGADYVMVINNDVLISDSQMVNKLVSSLENNPQAGVVSPKILFAPGYEYHKDRYAESEKGKVIWYAGGSFDWDNVFSVHRGVDEVDGGQYDRIEETGFASGCCLLIRRQVLEQVSLFDERLFAYYEDADWITRVDQAGWKQLYHGETSLHHKVSQTSGIASPLTDYLLTRNRLYFADTYASSRTKFALIRQALKFIIIGRPEQRHGVVDFILGKSGPPKLISQSKKLQYSLKLSVIVINYKTLDLTIKCLESIFAKQSGFSKVGGEVILIDNASEDGIVEEVGKRFPQVKFIGNSINRGFSGANNQGIDYSQGEYILLLNSDTEARKNSLQNLVSAADKLGGNAITAGRLFFPDSSDQDSVFNLPTVTGAIKEYFLGQKGSYFMFRPEALTRVECAVMACFMIPRRVINKIGKLDEGTFMYFEDVEYCRRAKQNNIPVYFVPSAEFIHHHGATSKKIGQDKSYELLKKGSRYYHGFIKYWLLWGILWLGQRIGAKTPNSRWTKT